MSLSLVVMLSVSVSAAPPDLVLERTVSGPPAEVYRAFTTRDGVRSFFAPDARIEPRVGGTYELVFLPEAQPGAQGSEGCRLTALEPGQRVAFTWNFPPSIPVLRASRAMTNVAITLEPASGGTRVRLTHSGFQEGADYHRGRAYFEEAWKLVLARLERRFRRGPIDWTRPWRPTAPAQLAFLVGNFVREDRTYEEHWSVAPGGLIGMSRELRSGKPIFYELSSIEPEGDELVLSIRMFTRGLKAAPKTANAPLRFYLEHQGESTALFRGEKDPKESLSYERSGDLLGITLVRGKGGVETFTLRELPASASAALLTSDEAW